MDNKNKFTSANWISLGIGIAIGAGLLITLIHYLFHTDQSYLF